MKWEYIRGRLYGLRWDVLSDMDTDTIRRIDGIDDLLRLFGERRWEMAGIVGGEHGLGDVFYFKRPLLEST